MHNYITTSHAKTYKQHIYVPTLTMCWCHEHENSALLQFKERFVITKSASYDPFSYAKISSWNASTDCCSWDGIQCDDHTAHVISIDLRSSHIFGTIDANSTLFHLKHLQTLDLSHNHFNYSQIPSRIGELSQLRYLNLSQAKFSGKIPQQVSHLTKLLSLDLRGSFYDSPFVDNLLTGIFHLPNLRYLNLGNNRKLTGEFPNFHSSAQITKLELAFTSFYGTLPASIGNLKSLNWLSISKCDFSGSIPPSFGNLTQLTFLDIENNKFMGRLSSFLVNLTKLSSLIVGYNEFTSDNISWICKLSRINELGLDLVNIGSEIPSCFANLTQLSSLSLLQSNLSGQIPSFLMNLTNLNHMNLALNHLQDNNVNSFPSWLWGKTGLKGLIVSHNSLVGKISPLICNLKSLVHLDLSFNNLSGMVPSCLGSSIQSLKALLLRGNKLIGPIPHTYTIRSALRAIDMSYNNLQDQLPRALVNCRMLEFIDVSQNQIIDSFPYVMGDLTGLVLLNLSNNMLSGSIPSSLGKLSKIETLDLSLNSLSGKIPQQLEALTFLSYLNVSFNNLSGPIPQNKQFATFQGNSFEGNQRLCGNPLSKKCEHDAGSPFTPPSASKDDEDYGFFSEFDWKIVLIGYGGGLIAGVALGRTFGQEIIEWLKKYV
uniref:LRR receptor-like serine/threonine-protein kinase At4g08850 family n=1 Tax=Cajanus cajan TaxID=3821 RepID=A0A151SZT1_CAJCA|nr:putative LRR receptor-like serine/threonine-protein kinase At4g08850 family [Cajanus cajan]